MSYGNLGGSSIGNLLRMIQEQKGNQQPLPVSADVGSPIRGAVQQPVQLPESVGTTHVVSVKPEATPPPSNVVSPMGPTLPIGPTIAPPTMGPQMNQPTPTPTPPPNMGPSAPSISAPSIGTSIKPSIPSPLVGMSSQMRSVPPKATMGQPFVGTPGPTPTPAGGPVQTNPSNPTPIDSVLRSIWDRLFKSTGGKAFA